jgi:hypothetical protein
MAPNQTPAASPFTPPSYDPATYGPARHSVAVGTDGSVHVTHHGPTAVPGAATPAKATAPAKGLTPVKAVAAPKKGK